MAKLVGYPLPSVGQDLTAVDGPSTVATANGLGQRNAIGQHAYDDAGNEYIYMNGIASLAAGDFVLYGQLNATLYTPARLLNDANTGGAGVVAIAMGAFVASTFGWYLIKGSYATANVATVGAPTAGAALYRSGTTGRASTTAAAKDAMFGAFLVGASVANVGPVFLSGDVHVMDQSTL